MGVLFCVVGAIAFGLLACVSKVAERKNCNASALVTSLVGWATFLMLLRTVTLHSTSHLPLKAVGIAIVFGICGAVAYFAFQTSIKIGKVTVGWLMMNLSAGVPAVVSIWIYEERLTPLKIIAFGLGLVSIFCLFWGQRIDEREARKLKERKD